MKFTLQDSVQFYWAHQLTTYMSGRYWGLCRAWSASLDRVTEEKSLAVAAFWKTSWTIVPFSICFEPPSKLCITANRNHHIIGKTTQKDIRTSMTDNETVDPVKHLGRDLSMAMQRMFGHIDDILWPWTSLLTQPASCSGWSLRCWYPRRDCQVVKPGSPSPCLSTGIHHRTGPPGELHHHDKQVSSPCIRP